MSSSGVVRVTIPINLRKTIQDIKEIASKHSDDDIYAMLKECNMDPNETVQKLLYLDTFHEVKRKRDKKKHNVSIRAPQRYRWTPGVQRRGAGSRGRNSSTYVSDDTGGSRQISAGQENGGTDHLERSSNHLVPVQPNNAAPHATISLNGSAKGPTTMSNGGSMHENNPKVSADNITEGNEGKTAADVSKSGKRPTLPTVDIKQLQGLNPGPTPTPTPTVASGGGFEGRDTGVYSSASDPVLVPSLNPRNPGAVGAIKRETGSQRTATDFSGTSLPESGLNAGQDVVNNSEVAHRTMISANETPQGVEKSQNSEASGPPSLLNHDNSFASITNQDSWSAQQVNGASKLMTSKVETVELRANVQSLPKVNDAALEKPTSQLDMKLEKLNLSTHQPVIFPDHIQVPEAYRNGLTFGSLDDTLVHSKTDSQDSKHADGTVMTYKDASREPSLSHQTTSIAREGDYPDHPQSHPHVPETLSPLEVNIPSGTPPKSDQSKPELLQPIGGSQYTFLHAAPDYSFGFMPPLLGPHLVQVEGAEVGNSSIPSTSGSSQPPTQTVGVGQSPVAVSPQLFPFLRQPYPSNYFPYNPYFPQIYMPHNAPQFLGHSGFPQQASTGTIYMPPPAAPTGVKFPVPPLYKPGTIAANLTHFGVPSAYGSYGSSAVGYGLGSSMTPGSSASNEDLAAPELKEKNIYPTAKQNEESHVWTSAPGRDLSALQANFFYNFPQGQQVAFSPAHSGQGSLAGMYHLTPTTAAPSIVQSIPQHSQAMAPSVESAVPPSGTYQQPHSQINWNSKLLNRENI